MTAPALGPLTERSLAERQMNKCGRVRVAGPSLVVEDDDTGMQGWIPPEDVDKVLLGDAARIYFLTDDGPVPAGHLVEAPAGRSMSILMGGCRYLAISSQVRTAIKYRHQAALFADNVQRRYNRQTAREAGTAGALLIRA
jgi:hypothetical protein